MSVIDLLMSQGIEKMVTTAEIRRLATKVYKERVLTLSVEKVCSLCEELLRTHVWSYGLVAFSWIFRRKSEYKPEFFDIFERWLFLYVHDWGDCDDFCTHAFGELLYQFPKLFPQILPWVENGSFCVRRAASVIQIYSVKKGIYSQDKISLTCGALIDDSHHLVLKGIGWLLKEYSLQNPEFVYEYLWKNQSIMNRVVFRYALQKLTPEKKKILMMKRK